MGNSARSGPDADERENPGDTRPNPTGVSSEKPAEGDDESPPPGPDSPAG